MSRPLLATIAALLMAVSVLLGWGVVGGGEEASADAPAAADQATLDANRALWGSLAIQDYRLTTQRSCFCPFTDPVRVLVRDGQIVEAGDPFGFPGDPGDAPAFAVFSVDDLFDEVQAAIDQPAADLVVEYDTQNGIPLTISVDQIALAIDDEFTITVQRFHSVPGAAERAQLQANRAIWESLAIDGYSLTTLVTCFCIDVAPVTVVVQGGQVVSRDPADAASFNVLTVADLFDKVSRAIDLPVDSLGVTYDPQTGIPVDLAIDPDFGLADEEEFIEVLDFTPRDGSLRLQALGPDWNLVGWSGGTPVRTATASIAGAFDVLFGWQAGTQAFTSFRPALSGSLNSLEELELGQAYWVRVTAAEGATWLQPVLTEPLTLSLLPGLNLVMWGGPDGTPVAEAVADLGRALRAAYVWNVAAQAFESFMPGGASFPNTATTVDHGAGLWVEVDRAVTWTQPAPTLSAPAEVADGEVVTLAVGSSLRLQDSPLVVTFRGVSADNRCPVDVVCIVAGEATAEFMATIDGEAQAFSLTLPGVEDAATVGAFMVRGVRVTPEPVSTAPIAPGDYRVTLSLQRDRFQAPLLRAPIESVAINVAESFPVQIFVAIGSIAASSCETFDHVTTTRSGTTIRIDVWNLGQPPAVLAPCLAVVTDSEQNVALGSDFVPGVEYTVQVNGEVRTFTTP